MHTNSFNNKLFVQEKNLELYFDLKRDWFRERKKRGIFKEKVHFFPDPDSNSSTKKAVLWYVPTLIQYFLQQEENKDQDEELENLLKRR